MGHNFHMYCFSCVVCFMPLTDTYRLNNGLVYCENDFQKLFGTLCSICNTCILGNVITDNDRSFHPNCFRCSSCQLKLEGDLSYDFVNDRLFCKLCSPSIHDVIVDTMVPQHPEEFNKLPSLAHCTFPKEASLVPQNPTPAPPSSDERPRQIRTILTEEQTAVLVEQFNQNPSPDMAEREQLATKLGLQLRVVLNWFQNRRAKLKRELAADTNSPSSTCSNRVKSPATNIPIKGNIRSNAEKLRDSHSLASSSSDLPVTFDDLSFQDTLASIGLNDMSFSDNFMGNFGEMLKMTRSQSFPTHLGGINTKTTEKSAPVSSHLAPHETPVQNCRSQTMVRSHSDSWKSADDFLRRRASTSSSRGSVTGRPKKLSLSSSPYQRPSTPKESSHINDSMSSLVLPETEADK